MRQAKREKSQIGKWMVLDSKCLERHALREPSKDRCDDQRSGEM